MEIYTISLITLWASLVVFMPIIAWFTKSNKSWGNFWMVWFFTIVITGLVLIFLIYAQDQFLNFIEKTIGGMK